MENDMKHDWHPDDSLATLAAARYYMRHRVCRKCGAKQSYEDISYDVMATPKLKQAWRPLVGRCTLAKRIAKKHNAAGEATARK